ncbi:MAG TPA: helix-turn-helix transcriptional regulator [Ktedonobacteraceae bacterium]
MKRFSYREHDYDFGQRMLTLRDAIGLTQAGLAQHLGVSRKAVGGWEAGESYPTVDHLQALITLAVRASAFPAGREEEEIRAFWKAAHQKVLLDEAWLAAVLSELSPPPALVPVEESGRTEEGSTPGAPTGGVLVAPPGRSPLSDGPIGSRAPAGNGPQVDWSDALDVPSFYGRDGELATLTRWMVHERCRMVNVLGMGGHRQVGAGDQRHAPGGLPLSGGALSLPA